VRPGAGHNGGQKRRDESRRGRHECLRHISIAGNQIIYGINHQVVHGSLLRFHHQAELVAAPMECPLVEDGVSLPELPQSPFKKSALAVVGGEFEGAGVSLGRFARVAQAAEKIGAGGVE